MPSYLPTEHKIVHLRAGEMAEHMQFEGEAAPLAWVPAGGTAEEMEQHC